jgi:hypothetical protein
MLSCHSNVTLTKTSPESKTENLAHDELSPSNLSGLHCWIWLDEISWRRKSPMLIIGFSFLAYETKLTFDMSLLSESLSNNSGPPLFILFIFHLNCILHVWVFWFHVCSSTVVCVCLVPMITICVLDSLELELQMVISYDVGAQNQSLVLWKNSHYS